MKWAHSHVYTLEMGAARIGVRFRENGDARITIQYGQETVWRYGAPRVIYTRGWSVDFAIWNDEQRYRVLDAIPGAIEALAREKGLVR